MSFLTEIRDFIEHHAPEIERVTSVAETVANDPLTKAAASATALTAELRAVLADLIGRADAEVARIAAEATANGQQAGHAAAMAEMAPSPPEQPVEGGPPAG